MRASAVFWGLVDVLWRRSGGVSKSVVGDALAVDDWRKLSVHDLGPLSSITIVLGLSTIILGRMDSMRVSIIITTCSMVFLPA